MSRLALACACLLLLAPSAWAMDACQGYAKTEELPKTFRPVSLSAIGPAQLAVMSDGRCTCNDLPAVQRRLGQQEPEGVNWSCDVADPADFKVR